MKYKVIKKGTFLRRPNRFIAEVDIDGNIETVHVKNTGRCKELLLQGSTVFLSEQDNLNRKTKYDLIAVKKGNLLVNIDSQIPNDVVAEWLPNCELFSKSAIYKREVTFGKSRFDFYIEDDNRKIFLEVKGVTLEENHIALFPDAPTIRGVKHINELCNCVDLGYEAYIIFVIQMKGVEYFKPNSKTHPEFEIALKNAFNKGVNILAFDCDVNPDSIFINNEIKVILN